MNVPEMILRILFQMNSMGFISGEYGGKNTNFIQFISAHSIVYVHDVSRSYWGWLQFCRPDLFSE